MIVRRVQRTLEMCICVFLPVLLSQMWKKVLTRELDQDESRKADGYNLKLLTTHNVFQLRTSQKIWRSSVGKSSSLNCAG